MSINFCNYLFFIIFEQIFRDVPNFGQTFQTGITYGIQMSRQSILYTNRLFLLIAAALLSIFSVNAEEMLDYEALMKMPSDSLYLRARDYQKHNHRDTAIGYYIALIGKYSDNITDSEKQQCAIACIESGEILYGDEQYFKAFDLYFKGLQICSDNISLRKYLGRIYKDIGNIYSVLGDNGQAIKNYTTALMYARTYKDADIECKTLVNLTGVHAFQGDIAEAKKYYNQLQRFKGYDSIVDYFCHQNLALIYSQEKKYDMAVSEFNKARDIVRKSGLPAEYEASVNGETAHMYEMAGLTDSALHYYRINNEFTAKSGINYMRVENLKGISRMYAALGNKALSDKYNYEYLVLSDSLFNINEQNRIKNSLFVYELDTNYRKIASLTESEQNNAAKIKRQHNVILAILAILVCLAVMFMYIYNQKKKEHEAYQELFQKNQELTQLNRSAREREFGIRHDESSDESNNTESAGQEGGGSKQNLDEDQKKKIAESIIKVMDESKEYCRMEFTLEDMARLVGSNTRYVSQTINETFGKNFRTFINDYRIEEAGLRLMDYEHYGHLTIKAIAESVGYKSHTNFIEIFKKSTGMTPSTYRKIAREQKNNI